jgi:hypothetical protein
VSQVTVYPNPVNSNGILNIENEAIKQGDKLEIYDMSGKLLAVHVAIGAANKIPVGNLPSGIYLLRIGENKGVRFEVK